MNTPVRTTLVELTRRTVRHAVDGTVPLADEVMQVQAATYYDPERWRQEVDRIFRRSPLVLGFTAELREPGSYKAVEVAGIPVLLVRSANGAARAFVNMCSHRGAMVVEPGTSGSARRFTCPYHAWSYDTSGHLVGVLDRSSFGDIDESCAGFTTLPCEERAGLIFVGLTPGAALDLDAFLCGYDTVLEYLHLDRCNYVGSQSADGPNWKVAYDGYLDFYHLPILHKATFGPSFCNKAIYDAWGPHQRVSAPDDRIARLASKDESTWTDDHLTMGVWTVFPHVSIAPFLVGAEGVEGGGRMYLVSTLFPGPDPDTSVTVQHFLADFEVTPELAPLVEAQRRFLLHVVREEDYLTGNRIQMALKTGAKPDVLFGRNELGNQRFHAWVERLVQAESPDDFAATIRGGTVEFQP
ncbi:MAG TPA: (2Fe-2S)-binding protein [Acidimicrobiaceae bacterium]|nr:(2Fe-2S)-binding protein [Acidimicrobiaceae bacterium]